MRIARRALGLLPAFAAMTAGAQTYPAGPIRLIVPSPPGGGTDTLSRILANRLGETGRWQVVVENRPGAGGNIGMEVAARATPDGQTMVMGESANLVINPYLYARMPFDPARDLAPVALIGTVPLVLVTSPARGATTPQALLASAHGGRLMYASSGNGTVGHLAAAAWLRPTGIAAEHVPYRGGAPAIAAVASGEVDLHFASLPAALGLIEGGQVRALAVTAPERVAQLPRVPSLAEAGYPGFAAEVLYGALVPAGTPAPVIATLSAEVNRALDAPDARTALARSGVTPRLGTPDAFAAFLEGERARWSRAVAESGARVD